MKKIILMGMSIFALEGQKENKKVQTLQDIKA